MKQKEVCALVQDLLPLYVEHLTTEETETIIKEHLETCKECRMRYEDMAEDMIEEQETESEPLKEIEYLKKIKRKTTRKLIAGIGGAVLFCAGLGLGKKFIYGTPVETYKAAVSLEDGKAIIRGELEGNKVYSHYKLTKKDGEKKLVVYGASSSIWNRDASFKVELDAKEAEKVGLIAGDKKVTPSGTVISARAAQIYKNKHAYIGDASKNGALANAIGIGEELGSYTSQLQTKEKPYGWTLSFTTMLEESNEAVFQEKMRGYACVLLAMVDNVEKITWTYLLDTQEGVVQKATTFTVKEANELLGYEVKAYGASEEQLAQLLSRVELNRVQQKKVELNTGKFLSLNSSLQVDTAEVKKYRYRLTLTGRMASAEADCTFIVFTNDTSLTFDKVAKSMLSSNTEDWIEDAVIVPVVE